MESCGADNSELDLLRSDLLHQLRTPEELDWDYFLETAQRAKEVADEEGRNMTQQDK